MEAPILGRLPPLPGRPPAREALAAAADELRRRAGERYRPTIELDYIDRLLKRF